MPVLTRLTPLAFASRSAEFIVSDSTQDDVRERVKSVTPSSRTGIGRVPSRAKPAGPAGWPATAGGPGTDHITMTTMKSERRPPRPGCGSVGPQSRRRWSTSRLGLPSRLRWKPDDRVARSRAPSHAPLARALRASRGPLHRCLATEAGWAALTRHYRPHRARCGVERSLVRKTGFRLRRRLVAC